MRIRTIGIDRIAGLAILLFVALAGAALAQERTAVTETAEQYSSPLAAEPLSSPLPERSRFLPREPTASERQAALHRVLALLEHLRGSPGPVDEVFARVIVTDRATGVRRWITRGTPTPELAQWVRDPDTAPEGESYAELEQIVADDGVEIVTRSIRRYAVASDVGPDLDPETEEEIDLRQRNEGYGLSFRIEPGLREFLLAGSGVGSGDDGTGGGSNGESAHNGIGSGADPGGGGGEARTVAVSIALKHVPRLDLPKAHDLDAGGLLWESLEIEAERQRRIIDRKKRIAALQAPLIRALEEQGARVSYASWLSGAVEAVVPVDLVPALAEHPAVFSIEKQEPLGPDCHSPSNDCFQGDDYYVAMDLDDFDDYGHNGRHGLSSKHSYTSRIVLALSEECIDKGNPAWRNSSSASDRRIWLYDCDPSGVCTQGGVEACSSTDSHGTRVAQMMAGDFMDGQDSSVSSTNRRKMTGSCPECRFFFLQDQNLNDRSKAEDAACDLGVDIFESSISTIAVSCDGNGSRDSNIQSLINCDVLYVQSASNNGSTGGCSTSYPADHPWTLTVSGIDTDVCDTAGEYYTSVCDMHTGSSIGGTTYDSSGTAKIIDLAAPYSFSNAINPGTRNPVTYGAAMGTSFGTPLVAGLTASFMDWWKQHVSTSLFYDNRARNLMMLFGDRSAYFSGISRCLNCTSKYWGAGRVGLVPFDKKSTWGIYRGSRKLSSNESWTFNVPIPTGAKFFKAVVWHTGKDYSNEPRIDLTLNPGGCTTPTKTLHRLDSKAMLLYGTGTDLLDSCTSMKVTIKNKRVGTSGKRRFHFAAYADSKTGERSY